MILYDKIPWVDVLYTRDNEHLIPMESGVYCVVFKGVPIYIGSSAHLKKRVTRNHHVLGQLPNIKNKIIIRYYLTKKYLNNERDLINQMSPEFNRKKKLGYASEYDLNKNYIKVDYSYLNIFLNKFISHRKITMNRIISNSMYLQSWKITDSFKKSDKQLVSDTILRRIINLIGAKCIIHYKFGIRYYYIYKKQYYKIFTPVCL